MIIETRQLTKNYGPVVAVSDLRLRVPAGGISAFLGPNGHGKSTTIKMLLGMTRPASGTGQVLGHNITDPTGSLEIRRRTGFVSEDKLLYGYMSVRQMLAFTRSFYPTWQPQREKELLARFELPLDRKVKQLSKGMRTKLALILALARGAELLILDEPSEGLDPVVTEIMLQEVVRSAAEGATVFFSSHQLSEAERIADHIFILKRGQVVLEGRLDELQSKYRRLNAVFAGAPPLEELRPLNLLHTQAEGHVLSTLTNGQAETAIAGLRQLGALSVEAHPVNLRELFLQVVQEQAQ
ncbi:ABC transporter ATP-binding protein [Paludibaculum fermentans]|uniref:ABC transporter ATP-binding protein n=1 Tax=Paludibaculum fermentans TaxID=1473598 RepID=A0A7S7NKW7_PALFE|nr:ABC transporter ATP-binding protein [Paludibaculum fermentans]QOY85535.1 ABC transporter ATP-binding protein [Paludibaculum fermentans]